MSHPKDKFIIIENVKEREKNREEMKKKNHEEAMNYIQELFTSGIKGIIIKLDSADLGDTNGADDYEKKTGVFFLDEKTLILEDSENNDYLVFNKGDGEVITRDITEKIHVIDKYDYNLESFIRKKH